MRNRRKNQSFKKNRVNNEIFASEVRLIGIKGEKIGVMNLKEAIKKAKIAGVDLVEISSSASPPVCRLIDYGKFIYEKNKLIKEQKKRQKTIQIKEIKFRPNIKEGDYKVKVKNIVKFLNNGDKVKITVRFRGREITHPDIGSSVLKKISLELNKLSIIDFFSNRIEGRQMIMILSPKK
ncbi:translation initiation factor IF-3 [Candidatus Riesia sp. GBBU]|nr:translation initiation factor IF-3 [Candidatus Riesia sp. GBBU]